MLVNIDWYDKNHETVLLEIEGQWSYSGYNHAYMHLIYHARQVSEKLNIICNLTNADDFLVDAKLLQVSPFIKQAVIVSQHVNHPAVIEMETILRAQNPAILIAHAADVDTAMVRIRRSVSARS